MTLAEDQISWLEIAQAKSADYATFGAAMELKNKELAKMSGDIERIQDQLRIANAELEITWDEDQKKHFWNASKTRMDWMTGDRETEVDTVHDLKNGFNVDPEKAKKVQDLHAELIRIQTRMEGAKTPEGKEVFSRKDIERELWSPLIMANIIPSNAVGDKYSQEAQVWNGACEIYKSKLEDYSKTASKYEDVKRGLRITADVASVVGTIAGESIKAANFNALSISNTDKKTAADYKLIPEDKRTPEQTEFLTNYDKNTAAATVAARDQQALQLATVVINGGLTVAGTTLDKRNPEKGWKIAEAAFEAIGNAAVASLGLVSKEVAVSDSSKSKTEDFKTTIASATSLVSYGFKAGKVVFRVHEICEATDEKGQMAGAQGLIKAIAGAVGESFAAFDTQSGKDNSGQDVAANLFWGKVGGLLSTAIIGSANAGFIAKHIGDSVKAGGLKNPSALVGALGLTVIAPIMLGLYDTMSDASRQNVTDTGISGGGTRNFQETTSEQTTNDLSGAKITPINDILAKSMDLLKDSTQNKENEAGLKQATDKKLLQEQVMAALKDMPPLTDLPPGLDLEAATKAMAEKLARQEVEDKKNKINDFKASLRDPTVMEEFFKDIQAKSDEEIENLKKLIGDSQIDPDDMEDEAAAKKALAALDKLILEAQALNQRWTILEAMTAGGAAILVAALPVAGLAVAIQKLAMDVAILVRKSTELNKWVKNMALTMGNNSVYGPAISGRLASASVQVSQQVTRVVFDAIGVAAESAKLADCMGVATGLSIANSMARSLTEFGFKMHKEAEIDRGWKLYLKALENPGDRKRARKAMKWNSTLSKCVLAYGIVKDGDPIAKEVARSCGLTPEVLADTKDVCGKVVTYFQTLYSDDPVVMKRIPLKKDWHPGSPSLSIDSWLRFKAAAVNRAKPVLSEASSRTPDIDRALSVLISLTGKDGNFEAQRDARYPAADPSNVDAEDLRVTEDYGTYLDLTDAELKAVIQALRAWVPLTGAPPEDSQDAWSEGTAHEGMDTIRQSLLAQAQVTLSEVHFEINVYKEGLKHRAALDDSSEESSVEDSE